MNRYSYGDHKMVQMGIGDWRCTCGLSLRGPFGFGRYAARDVMRFHVADLMAAAQNGNPP